MSEVSKKDVDELKTMLVNIQTTNTDRAEEIKSLKEDLKGKHHESADSLKKIDDQIEEFKTKFTKHEKDFEAMQKKSARSNPEMQFDGKEIDFKTMNAHMKREVELKGGTFTPDRELNSDNYLSIKSAMNKLIRRGPLCLSEEEKKTINTIVDPQGGYFALPEVSGQVLSKAFDGNGLMSVVNVVNTGSSVWQEIIDQADYADAAYFNELAAAGSTSDNEDFKELAYHPKEQIYSKKFSRTSLEDAFIDLETYVMGKLREGSDRQTAQNLVTGNAADGPRGILTYDAGTTFGTIEQITSGTSAVLKWGDVINLLPSALKDRYHTNASYAMQRSAFFGLLADTDGNARFQITDRINLFSGEGVSLSILGAPVVWEAEMATVAANALSVAFGDFKQGYNLVNRIGFSIIRDETNPKFVELHLRRRNTGDVRNFEAIKLLKIKA